MTPEEVAQWMLAELDRRQHLYQEDVAHQIRINFGEEFVYLNANGNIAIGRDVLKAFRALTGDAVIWERGQRMWRRRATYDPPGRQQD